MSVGSSTTVTGIAITTDAIATATGEITIATGVAIATIVTNIGAA
jgi:hypothetical protein